MAWAAPAAVELSAGSAGDVAQVPTPARQRGGSGPALAPRVAPQPGSTTPGSQPSGTGTFTLTEDQQRVAIPLIMVGMLQMDDLTRQLAAGALNTFIFFKVNPYITMLDNTGKGYAIKARANPSGHGMGAPCLSLFLRSLEYFIQAKEVTSKDEINIVMQEMKDSADGMKFIAQQCKSFRVHKMFDQHRVRITYQLWSDADSEIAAAMVAIGGEQRSGTAPRGAVMRQMQELVDGARKASMAAPWSAQG